MRRGPRAHTAFVSAAITVAMTLLVSRNPQAAEAPATVSTPSTASADVLLEDYVVKNGDTCVKVAQTRYGDPRRVADIHKYNQLGVSPHRLRVGSVLRLPVVNPDNGPEAQITFVRNQVEAFTPEPGYGFITIRPHPTDDAPAEVIVPIGSVKRIELRVAGEERARLGFSVPSG